MSDGVRVAVVGCGLVGTSVAMAATRVDDQVRGWDPDPEVLRRSAGRSGLSAADSLAEAVGGADVVCVCTPTADIPQLVAEALRAAPDAVVSDTGSVKVQVMDEVEASIDAALTHRFVGGHPMAGSERTGPDAASASLIDAAVWVLTPSVRSEPAEVDRLRAWVGRLGAHPVVMDAETHDRVVATVSHLPQVVSTALMGLATREQEGVPETLMLAAGGFRDLTRLAASNPELWAGILRANRDQLARAIDLFISDLASIRDHLADPDGDALESILGAATMARLALAARPKVRAGVAILQIPVPDRPGALAELTVAMSERGVNIEDLQILHAPEGGRGTVHLTVAGDDVDEAAAAAEQHGFEAFRVA